MIAVILHGFPEKAEGRIGIFFLLFDQEQGTVHKGIGLQDAVHRPAPFQFLEIAGRPVPVTVVPMDDGKTEQAFLDGSPVPVFRKEPPCFAQMEGVFCQMAGHPVDVGQKAEGQAAIIPPIFLPEGFQGAFKGTEGLAEVAGLEFPVSSQEPDLYPLCRRTVPEEEVAPGTGSGRRRTVRKVPDLLQGRLQPSIGELSFVEEEEGGNQEKEGTEAEGSSVVHGFCAIKRAQTTHTRVARKEPDKQRMPVPPGAQASCLDLLVQTK